MQGQAIRTERHAALVAGGTGSKSGNTYFKSGNTYLLLWARF